MEDCRSLRRFSLPLLHQCLPQGMGDSAESSDVYLDLLGRLLGFEVVLLARSSSYLYDPVVFMCSEKKFVC